MNGLPKTCLTSHARNTEHIKTNADSALLAKIKVMRRATQQLSSKATWLDVFACARLKTVCRVAFASYCSEQQEYIQIEQETRIKAQMGGQA